MWKNLRTLSYRFKNPKIIDFYLKLIFIDTKYIFLFQIVTILIDLNKIFPMEQSYYKFFITVKSYDEKTAENVQIFTLRKGP